MQPSTLSSTAMSSPFLSATSTLLHPSSLLSTENTQLKQNHLLFPTLSSTVCSPHSLGPVLRSTPSLAGGLSSAFVPGSSEEQTSVAHKKANTDPVIRSCAEDIPSTYSAELDQDMEHEDLKEQGLPSEMPVVEHKLAEEEWRQKVDLKEEYGLFETSSAEQAEVLKAKKYELLSMVACSLLTKEPSPGKKDWDNKKSQWSKMKTLAADITNIDPEFILKVALYTRKDLNICTQANFLLALAAHLRTSKPHLRRYFCTIVQLPSDWLEVSRLYSTCFSPSLPTCLKKALVDKFKQFSEYQLAKYTTHKHQGKYSQKKGKTLDASPEQWKRWSNLLRVNVSTLQKYLLKGQCPAVAKKRRELNVKNLIQRLHIKEPAEFVMSVLGKRYPADPKTFARSGLSGVWQSERAGQRMKLRQPDTWKTRLSQEGNTAATWEKLIDSNSLPFTAMLRNLRNMITQGISAKHHERILKILSSKSDVIQSRLLPFRFLLAYKVIMDLSMSLGGAVKPSDSSAEILRRILMQFPQGGCFPGDGWASASHRRLRATRTVPFVHHLLRVQHRRLQKTSQRMYTQDLLDHYRQALDKAVQISCRYNVPLIPGRTLIFCEVDFMESDWEGAKGLYLPPDSSESMEKSKQRPSEKEVAFLLTVMLSYCCEHSQVFLMCYSGVQEIQLKPDDFLGSVRHALKQTLEPHDDSKWISYSNFFSQQTEQKTKVDSIITLNEYNMDSSLENNMNRYQKTSNNDVVMVNLLMKVQSGNFSIEDQNPNILCLYGFSEQILKFVSERGSSRLLDHVECIDKVHNISLPVVGDAKSEAEGVTSVVPLPTTPKFRWRGVHVFISSAFRDMHSERDVLVRSVFPELRQRAAPYCLYLQEVELRQGVTEEDLGRAAELCLSEVCRSQLLLGILGEKYGLMPPQPSLPNLPQYCWLDSAPSGLSITEMEIRQFQYLYPDSAKNRMLFYFRSPHLVSLVPVAWRADFAVDSKETAAKMDNLKKLIRNNGYRVLENYPCEWGGLVDRRPCVKGLEEFGKAVIDDLWATIQKFFVEEADEPDLMSEIKEQEVYQHAQQQCFHGRGKLVSMAIEKVQECQQKGGILLVEGLPGEGKSVFMAALAHALRTPEKLKRAPFCDVIFYSTAASKSAGMPKHLLRCLVQWLKKRKEEEEELASSISYKSLLSEFFESLAELGKGHSLALFVDGADLIHDDGGKGAYEWIPECLPKGVCLVLSVTTDSVLWNTLSKKKGSILFPLGHLSLTERKEIVQKELGVYGEKLSDFAFNSQLQTLLMKKGAESPLYLHLACEELRNYTSFEKMKDRLQALPHSLCELVQHSLCMLQAQYGGGGLEWALAALAVSSTALRERDLYSLLTLSNDLSSTQGPFTWKEVLELAREPKSRVPMLIFSQLAQNLRSLIHPSFSHGPDEALTLTITGVRSAFEQLYLSTEKDRSRAHLILAAHLWVHSDPLGKDTFLHCDADSLTHLPVHLIKCHQWEPVYFLLSSFNFLYANVRHGLLHALLENYVLLSKTNEIHQQHQEPPDHLDELHHCHSFLKRHAHLLSHWPALFVQQALNEPNESSAHVWANMMTEQGGVHAVRWLNKNRGQKQAASELVSTFKWGPCCVALSPAGGVLAVGTQRGTLHCFHIDTSRVMPAVSFQEVQTLTSSCDGVSGCKFLDEGVVCTTSYDGHVEVWDIGSGYRTAYLNAHSNQITGCDVSSDRKHFATVSLDFNLKVWSSEKYKEMVCLPNPSPLNCVTFEREGMVLAVGCWDGAVHVWDWLRQEMRMTLLGHQCSVRSVAFSSSSSSLLCSGCLAGEVRLWSTSAAACMGFYQAHCGSTEALSFLPDGDTLLSAGHDGKVHLWSASLGCFVSVLGEQKKRVVHRPAAVADVAHSVAVANGYAAVGYHGDGIKLFSLESGERVWSTEDSWLSVSCMLWLEAEADDLLLSGSLDHHLRLWRRQAAAAGSLTLRGAFGVQEGAILALAQSATYVASASDDFTIALWWKNELTSEPWVEPSVARVLRGHSGGVTCLAFSPDEKHLLSGGKDQTLMVWKVCSSPPSLFQSLPDCHGDWIMACAWTASAMLSCSNDCRLCLWDIQSGSCIREVLTMSSLTTLCCWKDYVILGSADGLLRVWNSDVGMITEIQAHHSCIHNTTIISTAAPEGNLKTQDLLVATASEDGTVKLWHPLQVQHHNSHSDHSGAVQDVVSGHGQWFFSVSEDLSLRAWSFTIGSCVPQSGIAAEIETSCRESVTVAYFLERGELVACGYHSGRLQLWHHNSLVYSNKVSNNRIGAISSLPNQQIALASSDCSVTVWNLQWDSQHCTASLFQVSSYTVESPVAYMYYSNFLLGLCIDSIITDVFCSDRTNLDLFLEPTQPLGIVKNDAKSVWVLGENDCELQLYFILFIDPVTSWYASNVIITLPVGKGSSNEKSEMQSESPPEEQYKPRKTCITAAAMHKGFIVCGDAKGYMRFNQPPRMAAWSEQRKAHSDRISVLRLTDSTIISASYDKTVKLWDRNTKKQVGMFVCKAPVQVLEVNQDDPRQLVCGDTLGKIYFLSWTG
ncbi:telomerase protein component 1 [Electrophorus electricus]|uniref:telomerase protein component 1 n=1 Tax=Electrophorus electricus TaxID=8005 RepID=UPI0015D014CF|nr:telomerase protein component 1 [Electrophorus electricus]